MWRGRDIRNVAVDDLAHGNVAIIGKEVEALRLDIGRVHLLPLEVLTGELGVGRLGRLLGDGLDGRGPIDGLLGAGDVGQPSTGQQA